MNPGTEAVLLVLLVSSLSGCGEPYRKEGMLYAKATTEAIEEYQLQSGSTNPPAKPYWNDCGHEVTCLYLYDTQDQKLVEAIVASLLRMQAKILAPGVKLTVYSSAHDKPKAIFREITIK